MRSPYSFEIMVWVHAQTESLPVLSRQNSQYIYTQRHSKHDKHTVPEYTQLPGEQCFFRFQSWFDDSVDIGSQFQLDDVRLSPYWLYSLHGNLLVSFSL